MDKVHYTPDMTERYPEGMRILPPDEDVLSIIKRHKKDQNQHNQKEIVKQKH